MKHIVHKAYWDYEKEEQWLNKMAAQGLALSDYSWCRYVFEETEPGQYSYRIELLDNPPAHAESAAYLRFLEETGVECVATYMRWAFFRKKSSEGAFDIYTDIDSKLRYYKKIRAFWSVLMFAEFAAGFFNVAIGLINLLAFDHPIDFSYGNLIVGCLVIIIGILFIKLVLPISRKIRKLEREKAIRE